MGDVYLKELKGQELKEALRKAIKVVHDIRTEKELHDFVQRVG